MPTATIVIKPPIPAVEDLRVRFYPNTNVPRDYVKPMLTLELLPSYYTRHPTYFSSGPNTGSVDWSVGAETYDQLSRSSTVTFETAPAIDGNTRVRCRFVSGWGDVGDWSNPVAVEVVS